MSGFKLTTFLPLLVISLFIPVSCFGQTDIDQLKPEQYFDFWVGTWDLTWEASDGTSETGTNHIEKILDGKVIQENFKAESGQLKGLKARVFRFMKNVRAPGNRLGSITIAVISI